LCFVQLSSIVLYKHDFSEEEDASLSSCLKNVKVVWMPNCKVECFHIFVDVHTGAQPALHFGGAIFMKFHSMTSSCLFNRGTTLSQTVTYNNNVFLPADTKSIVYKHTHSVQRWLVKTERFTIALEAESAVSSEISDFTPYAHAQSNIVHIKCAEKTDDSGLGFGA